MLHKRFVDLSLVTVTPESSFSLPHTLVPCCVRPLLPGLPKIQGCRVEGSGKSEMPAGAGCRDCDWPERAGPGSALRGSEGPLPWGDGASAGLGPPGLRPRLQHSRASLPATSVPPGPLHAQEAARPLPEPRGSHPGGLVAKVGRATVSRGHAARPLAHELSVPVSRCLHTEIPADPRGSGAAEVSPQEPGAPASAPRACGAAPHGPCEPSGPAAPRAPARGSHSRASRRRP